MSVFACGNSVGFKVIVDGFQNACSSVKIKLWINLKQDLDEKIKNKKVHVDPHVILCDRSRFVRLCIHRKTFIKPLLHPVAFQREGRYCADVSAEGRLSFRIFLL